MRKSQWVFPALTVLVLSACGGDADSGTNPDPSPPAGSVSVTAGSNSDVFSPSDVSVSVGGTVTWSFGARPHNAIFASTAGAPPNIDVTSNAQVSRTFPTAGTFSYDCTLHPGMRGRVLVGTLNSPGPDY